MTKTQVYIPNDELQQLHRLAEERNRPVADLIREAIRRVWLRFPSSREPQGPVALWDGPFAGSSADHDAAFDEALDDSSR